MQAAAPVRVCGVRGPANERPIIDGPSESSVLATIEQVLEALILARRRSV